MIKLTASYSKKVPAGQEYSSQSYHCSVEVELPHNQGPDVLQKQIRQTFSLVRRSVEAELGGSGEQKPAEVPEKTATAATNGQKATTRQVRFILDLAKGQGLGLSALNDRVRTQYGVDSVYALERKQASLLVDELKAA